MNQLANGEFGDKMAGMLLGMAVGDALGLPFEGMSRRRIAKILGQGSFDHYFLFGRGMLSDDTEHACLTAQSLLAAPNDPNQFARSLAWRLRWWLVGLPASVGLATLRALLKLWLGFPPERSGVFSAGNGPAMRAPILGACLGNDAEKLRQYIRASTRLTHSDPRAEEGALLIAQASCYASRYPKEPLHMETLLVSLAVEVKGTELRKALDVVKDSLAREQSPEVFLERMNLRNGVSGYVNHTVPVALYAWLRSPTDFRKTIETAVRMGGDADTTAAIVGALAGATVGVSGIPKDWLDGLFEWPRSVSWMRNLSARLPSQIQTASPNPVPGPLPVFWPGIVPRNIFFLVVVLAHGFRRLLPPY